MKRPILLLMFLTFGACSDQVTTDEIAVLVAQEVERSANTQIFWPRFDPMAVPLAIYDGKYTYLFRHPETPDGFSRSEDGEGTVSIYRGRHPSMTANSSADIGGTMSATLLVEDVKPGQSISMLAGVAVHEAFHVFQRERHPDWAANEGDLFMYPVDSAALLSLRRLETEALRRALEHPVPLESQCWSRLAVSLRERRFSGMDSHFAAYERGTELNEGLATYVQYQVDGRKTVTFPTGGFEAADVRSRAYVTGAVFALLLDRIDIEWRDPFDADGRQSLDEALRSKLASRGSKSDGRCEFSDAEISSANERALRDVTAIAATRKERRAGFDNRKTWRLVIKAADGKPLWPQGFDPLNVERLEGGILHTRFLRLGNDQGHVETIDTGEVDIEALTVGAGPHPLFNGIREVSIVGLSEQEFTTRGDNVSIQIPGLKAEFAQASIHRSGRETVVQLK